MGQRYNPQIRQSVLNDYKYLHHHAGWLRLTKLRHSLLQGLQICVPAQQFPVGVDQEVGRRGVHAQEVGGGSLPLLEVAYGRSGKLVGETVFVAPLVGIPFGIEGVRGLGDKADSCLVVLFRLRGLVGTQDQTVKGYGLLGKKGAAGQGQSSKE